MTAVRDLTDEQIVAAVRHGVRLHNLAKRLDVSDKGKPALRRRLEQLELAGRLERPERLQAINSHFWQVAP